MTGLTRSRAATLAVAAVLIVAGSTAGGRSPAQVAGEPPKSGTGPVANGPAAQTGEAGPRPDRRVWMEAGFSAGFESNLEHDETSVRSVGLSPSLAFHFQNDAERPLVTIDYEIAPNRYTNSERFDRTSHYASVEVERRISRRWSVETDLEASIKGSSEDSDVSNQYSATQRVAFRILPATQIEPFVGYRIRRYPGEDAGQNAVNPYAGLRIKHRLERGRRVVASYRYDLNRGQDPRYNYIRRTWELSYETPLVSERDRLVVGAAYKTRSYLDRLTEVDDVDVPRHDSGWWVLESTWERPLGERLRLALHYKFETRGSNDPDKVFSAHEAGAALRYRW